MFHCVCTHYSHGTSGVARMTELPGHCMGMRSCALPKALPGGMEHLHRGCEAAENPHIAQETVLDTLLVVIRKGFRSILCIPTLDSGLSWQQLQKVHSR